MSKYNFQAWLQQKVSDAPEVVLAGKLEYLRVYLTDAMRDLRAKAGLTQAQLAEKLGVQQAAVSKLESALKDHELESVLHYLHILEADLLVAVKRGEDFYQVSDKEEVLLIDVPTSIAQKAEEAGMSLRQYVRAAIENYSAKSNGVREALMKLLESDNPVAVRVRERLRAKSTQQIVDDLEQCLSLPEEEDRIFAVKNVLAGSITGNGNYRNVSDEHHDEIELLNLAEELLEKLAAISVNHKVE
ncbi:helix-turn-helix domain-containing protein [Scytonema sp. NUACC26]|uniref:helix-turn-helix domain-containing protein n=1 Tax=Scytonema sp. NUACC26 TaxID=3140176 RepID=UPI0034DC5EC6